MSRIMYREMKDSDKEKESGKMVRLSSLLLYVFMDVQTEAKQI